jgi:NADH-quinone oxidoreductase subunit N
VSTETAYYLLPEFLLIAVATFVYVAGAFVDVRHAWARKAWSFVAVGGLIAAGVALWCQYRGLHWPANATGPELSLNVAGPLAVDLFSQYVRWLTLLVGLLFVLLAWQTAEDVPAPEYMGTLLMALAGVMIVASARDLVLLFLGLELLSIPTYLLLYLGRHDASSQESAVKYFFLSILSSAFLLYGFSFLYGVGGSTHLVVIREVLGRGGDALAGTGLLARVALVLIFAGLGFRITAVPFHFYAPDVYQGTTQANAGLLAVFPKIVGFVALVRITLVAMPGMEVFGWRVALILAILTMTLGNVVALWQDNIRRLLAYSSIAHAGYMLIGLAVGFAAAGAAQETQSFDGVAALLFYLCVYVLATTGTFAALAYLGQPGKQIDGVEELAGLGRTHPWTGAAVAIFMFSLAGIPPLAGFWGKLSLFGSALGVDASIPGGSSLRNWFIGLAVAGALNAAVAAAYYLRIVAVMYFQPSVSTLKGQGGRGAAAAVLLSALLVLSIGFYPVPLVRGSHAASLASRQPVKLPAVVADQPAAARVAISIEAVNGAAANGATADAARGQVVQQP